MDEPLVLKKERVTYLKSTFVQHKGDLVLTPTTLSFTIQKGLVHKQEETLFSILVANILNVRAKKAFAAGIDHLEILYRDGAKERKLLFQRGSVAQWASNAASIGHGGLMGRVEAISLANWEKAINVAKLANLHPNTQAETNKTPLDLLKGRLAKGEVFLEEYKALKEALED